MSEAAHEEPRVIVYSVGICAASVCAINDADADEVAAAVNAAAPTGISSKWEVSDEAFATGEPNPCPCNGRPESRRHWLLHC